MDSDGPFCILTDVEELPDDGVIGCAPVHEEQVMVFKAGVRKTASVVHLLVEPDDGGDVVLPEVRDVRLRSMQRVPLSKRGNRSGEFRRRYDDVRQIPLMRCGYRSRFCSSDEAR